MRRIFDKYMPCGRLLLDARWLSVHSGISEVCQRNTSLAGLLVANDRPAKANVKAQPTAAFQLFAAAWSEYVCNMQCKAFSNLFL
jgi:hypothetical protein